jgi:hypothetical protein
VALLLMLALGFLPDGASGQHITNVAAGTATQMGFLPPPRSAGNGQLRMSGETGVVPQDLDLTKCALVPLKVLFDPAIGTELIPAPWIGQRILARRGSKPNEAIFETDRRVRPTLRIEIENLGKIEDLGQALLDFTLKVDRAIVLNASWNPGAGDLETAFDLEDVDSLARCPHAFQPVFETSAEWNTTGPSGILGHIPGRGWNIRTPPKSTP